MDHRFSGFTSQVGFLQKRATRLGHARFSLYFLQISQLYKVPEHWCLQKLSIWTAVHVGPLNCGKIGSLGTLGGNEIIFPIRCLQEHDHLTNIAPRQKLCSSWRRGGYHLRANTLRAASAVVPATSTCVHFISRLLSFLQEMR
jgi:hypothetical protein